MTPLAAVEIEALLCAERTRPLLFVTVGSDHHRFDRLVGWVDSWMQQHVGDVDCVIQYGTASPPAHARGVDYVDHSVLDSLLTAADIVVVQGGPMSIIESLQHGKRPVVVPRIARLNEVVDDHQRTFCAKLAGEKRIDLVEDERAMHRRLDSLLADPTQSAVTVEPGRAAEVEVAVDRLRRTADSLLQTTAPARPVVMMLGGAGRSGSTLLERMIDQVPGATALGEVVHLWERGLLGDELCGCGRSFSSCPFWSAVGARAFGGWGSLDAGELVDIRRSVERQRYIPALLGAPTSPRRRLMTGRLSRTLHQLMGAAQQVAASRLLVDSSKHPAHALLLRRTGVELRCVLVVRDPRAVAHSWRRVIRRPEIVDRHESMPRYNLVYSSLSWFLAASMFEGLRALGVPVLVVRYEDLVADPTSELRRVLEFGGLVVSDDDLAHVRRGAVRLGPSHTVAGNPMRFTTGDVALRSDDEWRNALSSREQRLVAWLTAPLRWRYHYR